MFGRHLFFWSLFCWLLSSYPAGGNTAWIFALQMAQCIGGIVMLASTSDHDGEFFDRLPASTLRLMRPMVYGMELMLLVGFLCSFFANFSHFHLVAVLEPRAQRLRLQAQELESLPSLALLQAAQKRMKKASKRMRRKAARKDLVGKEEEEEEDVISVDHEQPNPVQAVGHPPREQVDAAPHVTRELEDLDDPATHDSAAAVSSHPADDEGLRRRLNPDRQNRNVSRPPSPHIDETQLCVICLSRAKTHVILPCMHKCVCAECSRLISSKPLDASCPMCRGGVQLVARVFE